MKAYISKYALSADVYEVEGALSGIVFRYTQKGVERCLMWNAEVFATREAAVADAELRRDEKVKWHEKHIKRLKAIKFK